VVRAAVLSVSLALCAACTQPGDKADVADVNARNALDRVAALERRVDELERQNESTHTSEASIREKSDMLLARKIDSLADKHNMVVDRVYLQK